MAASKLTAHQTHALFDIVTHHQAYEEVKALQDPNTIASFGPPLEEHDASADSPSSPLIQALLKRFILTLPGLRDISPDFWRRKIHQLFSALAEADLSESYDKGSIGIRKTLATAIAAMMEYCARGISGGYAKGEVDEDKSYEPSNVDDVVLSWDAFLQQLVHGELLKRMFEKAEQTDQLEDHESLVQATHEYIFVILASFLHYVLIVSPRGQSLLPLLVRTKDMMPWFAIRQTLKVGNAATMLNGMVKILLAKMNMSTVTSWFGAERSDKGMNLLQQIISTVLGWDIAELQKRATSIEKDNDAPSPEQREFLKKHCDSNPEEHASARAASESRSKSIVFVVLSESFTYNLSERQHQLALDYLAIQLAICDRQKLVNVLCHHQPDLLTSSVQDLVDVYSPIIRALHSAVDLSGGTADLQAFLRDLIDVAQISSKSAEKKPPSVEDFVRLLKKHQGSSHRFIHQALKNGKELRKWYFNYAEHAVAQYRRKHSNASATENANTAAGDLTPDIQEIFDKLSQEDQEIVKSELDAYAAYLEELSETSTSRMRAVLESTAEGKSEIAQGPGVFLAKWQAFIDATPITPETAQGNVRHGGDDSVKRAKRVDVDGLRKGTAGSSQEGDSTVNTPKPPRIDATIRLLHPDFRMILVNMAKES